MFQRRRPPTIHSSAQTRGDIRRAADRAARLACAFQLDAREASLEALEAALRDVTGQLSALRRAHHLRRGRQARPPGGPGAA